MARLGEGARLAALRTSWGEQPEPVRHSVTLVVQVALVVGILFWQSSIAWALAIGFAVSWLPKLPSYPRLAAEAALVLILAFTLPPMAVALAIGFLVSWLPHGPRRLAVLPVAVGLAVAYPYYVSHLFTIPIFGEFPSVATAVVMVVFIMMAVGLNVVVGYAGLLDLGYVAFYAMGAYTAAWFASLQFPQVSVHFGAVGIDPKLAGFHISIWLLLLAAGVVTAIAGVIIGLPTLRLRGDYLAIVTLGFGEIMPQIARNGDNLFGTGFNLTNGPNGITPIDSPGFGGTLSHLGLPANYVTAPNSANLFYWTALVLLLLTVFCSVRLRDSRLGRAWIAIREDEVAAAAMGVPLMRTKTWAYATGAFFGGIAGAYFASFKSATFPGDFFFNISVFILSMVILGGMGNIWGVIVGAAFLAYLDREGLANTGAWINSHLHTHLDVPLYESGIFGVILLVVMLFRPEGLLPSTRRKMEFEAETADEPLYDAQV